MVHVYTESTYECEVCYSDFSDSSDAEICESRPIAHDVGIEVGDTVIFINSADLNETGVVQYKRICGTSSIYTPDKYWHTPHYWLKDRNNRGWVKWDQIKPIERNS